MRSPEILGITATAILLLGSPAVAQEVSPVQNPDASRENAINPSLKSFCIRQALGINSDGSKALNPAARVGFDEITSESDTMTVRANGLGISKRCRDEVIESRTTSVTVSFRYGKRFVKVNQDPLMYTQLKAYENQPKVTDLTRPFTGSYIKIGVADKLKTRDGKSYSRCGVSIITSPDQAIFRACK